MSTKLQNLLSLLSDNVWHNIDETAKTLKIPQKRFRQVIALLTEKDLIQHNPATNQIKLSQNWKTLLINQKETQAQPTAAVGTIIIPPQKNTHDPIDTHNKPNRHKSRTGFKDKPKNTRNSNKRN